MRQVVEIVRSTRADWPRLVVVISALSGVTNLLLDSAASAAKGQLSKVYPAEASLLEAHDAIAGQLVQDLARRAQAMQEINHLVGEFTGLCRAIAVLGEATPRALDAVAGLGERMSVRLLAAALDDADIPAQYVEATQLIVTDSVFQNAHPDFEQTARRTQRLLGPILDQGRVPVVTGFIAATPEGVTTTLGRGGSDYTAGILSAALPANEVWIWTDVDGVMSADPRARAGRPHDPRADLS